MKKYLLFICVITTFLVADVDVSKLSSAHTKALQTYQSKDANVTKSIALLKAAGIENILKEKPKEMTQGKYVQLLNDYGFFLQQSANFDHNVTMSLDGFPFIRNKRVETDERYLDSEHIKNFTQKTKNLCQAVNYLDRVIELSPKRSVAYLNLADTYWQLYLYRNKISIEMGDKSNFIKQAGCKLFKTGYETYPEHSILSHADLLARKSYLLYQDYAKLMQENNQTKKIPNHVQDFLKRPKRYIVLNDKSPATGDATVCQELQIAFDRFDCAKCKDDGVDELINSNRLWLYKGIAKKNTQFTPIFEPTVHKYFYSYGREDNNKTGMFHYKYNNNVYVFGNSGGVGFSYWSKRIAEEGAQIPYQYKCDFQYINLKQKNKWENEL